MSKRQQEPIDKSQDRQFGGNRGRLSRIENSEESRDKLADTVKQPSRPRWKFNFRGFGGAFENVIVAFFAISLFITGQVKGWEGWRIVAGVALMFLVIIGLVWVSITYFPLKNRDDDT
jgi:hypothetical protein